MNITKRTNPLGFTTTTFETESHICKKFAGEDFIDYKFTSKKKPHITPDVVYQGQGTLQFDFNIQLSVDEIAEMNDAVKEMVDFVAEVEERERVGV